MSVFAGLKKVTDEKIDIYFQVASSDNDTKIVSLKMSSLLTSLGGDLTPSGEEGVVIQLFQENEFQQMYRKFTDNFLFKPLNVIGRLISKKRDKLFLFLPLLSSGNHANLRSTPFFIISSKNLAFLKPAHEDKSSLKLSQPLIYSVSNKCNLYLKEMKNNQNQKILREVAKYRKMKKAIYSEGEEIQKILSPLDRAVEERDRTGRFFAYRVSYFGTIYDFTDDDIGNIISNLHLLGKINSSDTVEEAENFKKLFSYNRETIVGKLGLEIDEERLNPMLQTLQISISQNDLFVTEKNKSDIFAGLHFPRSKTNFYIFSKHIYPKKFRERHDEETGIRYGKGLIIFCLTNSDFDHSWEIYEKYHDSILEHIKQGDLKEKGKESRKNKKQKQEQDLKNEHAKLEGKLVKKKNSKSPPPIVKSK